MFTIIDIETCGGNFSYPGGRIIEICIIVHDGLQAVETFSTLINPECPIPRFYSNLTGITDQMVEDAPTFPQVARKILELTQDRIFVAHNVSFDYNFIRAEFASLGYAFKRETLCTLSLAKKLLPGMKSYGLGNLCLELQITNNARHRAQGDTEATVKLFDILLQAKANNPQYKNMGVQQLMTRRIDNIKKYILAKIPEACGVYYFLNRDKQIIYIGKSINMQQRAKSHFNSREAKSKKMLNDLYDVDWVLTGSELIALLLESEEIKHHKPHYNRSRIKDQFTHSIEWYYNNENTLCFRIIALEEAMNPLLSFTSAAAARERLELWINENELCMGRCGLVPPDAVCFNHHIKKCHGICAGIENSEEYNLRAERILNAILTEDIHFALIDKGRDTEELSVVLVENRRYTGYGYVPAGMAISTPEQLEAYISRRTYYPDADILLRGWMKQKKSLQKVVWKDEIK